MITYPGGDIVELTLFDLFINLVQSLIFGFLTYCYLETKKGINGVLSALGLCFLLFAEISFFNYVLVGGYENGLLIIYVLTISLYGFFFSSNNKFECIALGIMILILCSAGNIVGIIVTDFICTSLLKQNNLHIYSIILQIVAMIAMFVFSTIIVRFRNKLSSLDYRRFSMYLIIIFVINLIVTILETMYYSRTFDIDSIELSLIMAIVLTVIISKLFFDLQEDYLLFHQNAIMQEQLEQLAIQFSEINDREKKISSLKHDLQNNNMLIKSLILSGELEKAVSVIDAKSSEVFAVESLIYTGNVLIDSVLNSKKSLANKKGIEMKIVFNTLELDDTVANDVCTLLYTSLDNAIENINNDHKYIKVFIERNDNMLIIRVINSAKQNVLINNPNLRTTKKDKNIHGFGIRNMKTVAAKYNGYVYFSQSYIEFECKIIIPIS